MTAPSEPPAPADQPPTVLVVEDNEDLCCCVAHLLTQEGYLVLTATTGHDALATLRQPLAPIDVALLDVRLPDVDGIDLCARLREMYPRLPVIVCSGEATPDEVRRLLELGVRRYLIKPVSPDEILSSVEAVLP